MITRIIIEHFKSIEHCDLTLGPVNIFVGPNGSGKSNIIDAISFLKDAVEHGLDHAFRERLGFESVRQWSEKTDHDIGVRVHVKNDNGFGAYGFSVAKGDDGYFVREENGSWTHIYGGKPAWKFSLTREKAEQYFSKRKEGQYVLRIEDFDPREGFSENTYSGVHRDQLTLKPIKVYHDGLSEIESFSSDVYPTMAGYTRYNIFPNTLRDPQKHSMSRELDSVGNNLYYSLFSIEGTAEGRSSRSKIFHGLRLLMPNLDKLRIEELGGFLVPLFEVAEPKPGNGQAQTHTFNVAQVSDGTLRALGLLTALYHPDRPGMIALEEPEQMLHPGALAVLAEAIKESSEQSQIFITTHSPDLLDHFDPESVFAVEMVDGVTKVAGVSEGQMASVREGLFTLGEIMSMEGVMRASPPPPDNATGTDDA